MKDAIGVRFPGPQHLILFKKITDIYHNLENGASKLIFLAIFLYWEGFMYLNTYFNYNFSISANFNDFSYQDILVSGLNPLFLAIFWSAKKMIIIIPIIKKIFYEPYIDSAIFFIVIAIYLCLFKIINYIKRIIISKLQYRLGIYNAYLSFISNFKNIFLIPATIFFVIFILLFLPQWAAIEAKNFNFSILNMQPYIDIHYRPPTIIQGDVCDKDKCVGRYREIFEGKDYLYLLPEPIDRCNVKIETGTTYDTGKNGEKIGVQPVYKNYEVCRSITIPKERVVMFYSH